MFVIDQKPSYKWPVTVESPADGGKFDKQTFEAEFKRLSQSRMNELGEQMRDPEFKLKDRDVVDEVLVGWSGIKDANLAEVPFSEATKNVLLDIPLVSAAIVRAFMDSYRGAKAKN